MYKRGIGAYLPEARYSAQNITLHIYIYIYIYASLRVTATMNLYYNFILRDKKMADFEPRQFEIGPEFMR